MGDAIVIIPTYNERENIRPIVEAVFSLPVSFHILIIDDQSPDGTAGIVRELQNLYNLPNETRLHLIERKGKMGLGTAYLEGFRFSLANGYKYILEMDADFSHSPKDLVKLYETCVEQDYDLAIGSRYVSGVNVVNWPMGRVLLSYYASYYVRFITGIPVRDTTAGFVCYTRAVLAALPLETIKFLGYAFQIEMKFLAWKHGFKIREIPIIFTDRTQGQSKMSGYIFREAFLGVIAMTVRSWFMKYPQRTPTSKNERVLKKQR